MLRSLIYYRRLHLAVALGAAVTTAVLTGALLVGDSVRGSLRDLSLERLGRIDFAILSDHLFRQDLANSLSEQTGFAQRFAAPVPALLLTGSVSHGVSQTRAAGVNINGVTQDFFALVEPDSAAAYTHALARRGTQLFAPVLINASLQRELQAQVGDQILLSFKSYSEIPQAFVLGRRNTEGITESVRLTVARILPDRHTGSFGLRAQQYLPYNAFVALPVLQRALRRSAEVNALLVSATTPAAGATESAIAQELLKALRLEDAGLQVREFDTYFSLTSRELILKPALADLAQAAADDLQLTTQRLLTYLANTLRCKSHFTPYSTITALQVPPALGELKLTNASSAPALAEDEILLNTWAAQDLAAEVGDTVQLSYYLVGEREQLFTQTQSLRVRGIVPLRGLAADRGLAPPIPGVNEMENMQDWQPPFPVDLSLIRPQDEKYWDDYRATPKAFVSEATGRKLWQSRFGEVNAMRFAAATPSGTAAARSAFEQKMLSNLNPALTGFTVQSLKAQGLQAAEGATDFGGLFIGFSFFLMISSVLLVGMLFRLGVEQRASELGLFLAAGYTRRAINRRFLKEGLWIAVPGVLLGTIAAAGYASLMMFALRTWWGAAVGTSLLFLHLRASSLLLGAALALAIICFTIMLALRQFRKITPITLLRGVTVSDLHAPSRTASIVAVVALALSLALLLVSLGINTEDSTAIFFGSGAMLLTSGLAFFLAWMRKRRSHAQLKSLMQMAARNTGRQYGRSLLSTALVACACFIIVAVAANRREKASASENRQSGAGGFTLLAETTTPLSQDLNFPAGRTELGFADADSAIFASARFYAFRMLPGEDASCLNLYKPQQPRVLGMSNAAIARGGFSFQAKRGEPLSNPWQLLQQKISPEVIPAIGDYNSVRWILHLDLGDELELHNERGDRFRLRFVGLLQSSILQSEVIISEENFLKNFPHQSGYSYFLIDSPSSHAGQLAKICESVLSRYGFDATGTREKLAKFQAVENTYLAVFAVLGGLGLLLGTLGLGVVLARNLIERRGELATLRAFGFQHTSLTKMLLAENGFLILCGIGIGTLSALLAVAPHLSTQSTFPPWLGLSLILSLVLLIGLLASALALSMTLRAPLLPALKAE